MNKNPITAERESTKKPARVRWWWIAGFALSVGCLAGGGTNSLQFGVATSLAGFILLAFVRNGRQAKPDAWQRVKTEEAKEYFARQAAPRSQIGLLGFCLLMIATFLTFKGLIMDTSVRTWGGQVVHNLSLAHQQTLVLGAAAVFFIGGLICVISNHKG